MRRVVRQDIVAAAARRAWIGG